LIQKTGFVSKLASEHSVFWRLAIVPVLKARSEVDELYASMGKCGQHDKKIKREEI
jgi:hypothetical protein